MDIYQIILFLGFSVACIFYATSGTKKEKIYSKDDLSKYIFGYLIYLVVLSMIMKEIAKKLGYI